MANLNWNTMPATSDDDFHYINQDLAYGDITIEVHDENGNVEELWIGAIHVPKQYADRVPDALRRFADYIEQIRAELEE